jgi:hypothetical protein
LNRHAHRHRHNRARHCAASVSPIASQKKVKKAILHFKYNYK